MNKYQEAKFDFGETSFVLRRVDAIWKMPSLFSSEMLCLFSDEQHELRSYFFLFPFSFFFSGVSNAKFDSA